MSTAPVIRLAADDDIPTLSALAVETFATAFGHSMSEADLAAHLTGKLGPNAFRRYLADDTVLVAENADALIGYVQVGVAGPATAQIRRLYVHADHQSRHIGAALLRAALDLPAVATAGVFTLEVWERNTGGIRFYERHGFEITGETAFQMASGPAPDVDFVMTLRRPVT